MNPLLPAEYCWAPSCCGKRYASAWKAGSETLATWRCTGNATKASKMTGGKHDLPGCRRCNAAVQDVRPRRGLDHLPGPQLPSTSRDPMARRGAQHRRAGRTRQDAVPEPALVPAARGDAGAAPHPRAPSVSHWLHQHSGSDSVDSRPPVSTVCTRSRIDSPSLMCGNGSAGTSEPR